MVCVNGVDLLELEETPGQRYRWSFQKLETEKLEFISQETQRILLYEYTCKVSSYLRKSIRCSFRSNFSQPMEVKTSSTSVFSMFSKYSSEAACFLKRHWQINGEEKSGRLTILHRRCHPFPMKKSPPHWSKLRRSTMQSTLIVSGSRCDGNCGHRADHTRVRCHATEGTRSFGCWWIAMDWRKVYIDVVYIHHKLHEGATLRSLLNSERTIRSTCSVWVSLKKETEQFNFSDDTQ